jgi:hypothetical protein
VLALGWLSLLQGSRGCYDCLLLLRFLQGQGLSQHQGPCCTHQLQLLLLVRECRTTLLLLLLVVLVRVTEVR